MRDLGSVSVIALAGVVIAVGLAACGATGTAHADRKAAGTARADRKAAKTYLIVDGGTGLASRPTRFCTSADGASCLTNIRWTHWGHTDATAQGTYTRQTCKPNCASGPTLSYEATLRATDIRTCQGTPTYTDLAAWTKHRLSDGAIETTTLLPGTPEKCPSTPTKAAQHTTQPSEYDTPVATETCELYRSGSDVRLAFFGADAGQQACEKVAQDFSGESGYWIASSPPSPEEPLRQICALQSPKDDDAIVVQDSGSAFYGTRICGVLAKDGWTLDHEILHDEEEARQRKEAEAAKEREEAERKEAAALEAGRVHEAREKQEEEHQLKAEERAQKRQEAKERAKEAEERHSEAEKQHEEEAEQHRESEEEERRIDEENRRIEREDENA